MAGIYALSLLITGCVCFNVDVKNALMFSNEANEKWVVVGATKANFTTPNNYTTPGNVYTCRLNLTSQGNDNCTALNLEQTKSFRWGISPGYEADNELQGASMAMIDDTIVTCAPLWHNLIPCGKLCPDPTHCISTCKAHPVGICFNMDKTFSYNTCHFDTNSLKNDTAAPKNESRFYYEFAQIGISISQKKIIYVYMGSPVGRVVYVSAFPYRPVLLGAPGLIENRGGFVLYTMKNTPRIDSFFDVFATNVFRDGKNFQDGDLMGYSVTTGIIAAGSKCSNVTVYGAPHFITTKGIEGSVFVVCASKTQSTKSVDILKQFFGRKSGGGFGSSVVFQDVNNDGLDDLFVGEPMYFDIKTKSIDVGAVYIYYGKNDPSVILEEDNQVLRGSEKENGKFGISMEGVGDLNKDNFNDIVISAPYEDDLTGAIYIYFGEDSFMTLSQRIIPKDIGMDLQSFGWYISAAYDIDENQYPDFLVGSYMADTVSVFLTRPVIILNSTIEAIPNPIPLNSSGQRCEDEYFRPCVSIRLCFTYSGEFVPEQIRLYYNLSADINRTQAIPSKSSRVSWGRDRTENCGRDREGNQSVIHDFIDVTKKNESCVVKRATVQTLDREFYVSLDESLKFETKFELIEQSGLEDVPPIIANYIKLVNTTSATFSNGCNGTCHPDLHIDTELDADVIILDELSEIILKVHISNRGDQSYGTQLLIDYSNNTKYIAYYQPQDENTRLIVCDEVFDTGRSGHVECNMETIFFPSQIVAVHIRFSVTRSALVKDNETLGNFNQDILIHSVVQSATLDDNDRDNTHTASAKVKLKSSVELSGISIPDQLQVSDRTVFTHSYNIFNHGPSSLNDYIFKICLPVISDKGDILIAKKDIKVKTSDIRLTWDVIEFPEDTHYITEISTTGDIRNIAVTSFDTTPVGYKKEKPGTETKGKLKFNVLTCESHNNIAILEVRVDVLEANTGITFELPFNLSESMLDFQKLHGITYKTLVEYVPRNDGRYITIPYNTSQNKFNVSTEIYERKSEVNEISIWIIIGGSVGGTLLLVIVGVILKKCGFFERKKRDDVKKWKRQSGYYANRQTKVSMIEHQ